MVVLGWAIGGFITSEVEFNEAFEKTILYFQEYNSTEADNWALGLSINYMVEGFGIAAIGFVAMGVFIYQMFPVPIEFVDPIAAFVLLDLLFLGIFSYLLFNGLFALILLAIEKTGLVNWGEKI